MPIIKNVNELNERITFQETQQSGPDPSNVTVQDIFSCWAQVRTQNIKDVKAGVLTLHEDLTEFVVRYHLPAEINNAMLIKWKGDSYNIVKVNRDNAYKKFNVILGRKQN